MLLNLKPFLALNGSLVVTLSLVHSPDISLSISKRKINIFVFLMLILNSLMLCLFHKYEPA